MKMKIMTNRLLGCLLCMMTLSGMAAGVSDVVAKQRWPWSRLVDIDYMLTGEQDERVDVALTAKDGSTTLTLPTGSLTGDLYNVVPGQKHIVWDPTQTAYTNNLTLTQFNVDLAATAVPLYMIVDLSTTPTPITYVYETDLTNGLWGSWERNPVTNRGAVVQSVIWTGVTTNDIYKTDKLVLRRIPAGSYYEGDDDGSKEANVTLTKGLYAGVFAITQQQWKRVMTGGTGTDTQAKHTISYWEIREGPGNSDDPAVDWPSNKTVNANSFMGRLRTMTGISEFDLPTEAQWEYACKAGTTTVFNDGKADAKYTGTTAYNNGKTNTYLNVLGWYRFGAPTPPTVTQSVGNKAPNAWGLYDTHGNIWEWCLDWWDGSPEIGIDPDGAKSGSHRVRRGGAWGTTADGCRSAYRNLLLPDNQYVDRGFRLMRTLP